MTDRGQESSRGPQWGASFVRRYEYLLIYIAVVATLTLVVALLDR